ncbi:MAG TPA: hypothetical protein VFF67_07380 [Thermoplasmata archaeon]|nr:hypothetical protein [Thermoplasmata archaeon]
MVAVETVGLLALLVGLGYASWTDWKYREVSDLLWVGLVLVGSVVGFVALAPSGWLPTLLWLAVSLLVLEHLVPWDAPLERLGPSVPGAVELAAYVAVGVAVFGESLRSGVGPHSVPIPVIAVYVCVLAARGLFELGVLYGGADAKAMMVAALLVPVDSVTLLTIPTNAANLLSIYPFAVNMLLNGALLAITVPIAIAFRNLRRREFQFPRGFVNYRIDIDELPNSFVWVKDPALTDVEPEDEPETSADDRQLRQQHADRLRAAGVRRVWVSPQLPFVVFMWLGAILTVVAGSLLFDVLAAA